MARIETDPNYTTPTFSRATAATDPFKKEDVQLVASALSTHDHSTGKGLPIAAGSIPSGTITSVMIADGTIATGDLADGSVTSAKIADGTITSADIADAGIANVDLGPDVARASLLVNGGFEWWQRGTGPFSSNGVFSADRWYTSMGGASTLSVSADGANVDVNSARAATFTYTHAAAGSHYQQIIEDFYQLRGQTVSVSFRVKTSTANAVRAAIFDSVNSWRQSGTFHSGGGTYQTITLTAPIAAGATQVAIGLSLEASCVASVDNAMLVVGSQPANYVPLHPADDLARCLRYYEVIGQNGSDVLLAGYNNASSQCQWYIPFKVQKPVMPTVTKVGTWGVANCGQPTIVGFGGGGVSVSLQATATGAVAAVNNGAGAAITAEANP